MMEMKFWGTRGSCAAPFADRLEFGGNTSCVSIRSGNCWLIFDAGSGIIPLAAEIRQAASEPDAEPCRVKLLITHFHLDHIIGLPMFLAALPKTVSITLYAVSDGGQTASSPCAAQLVSLMGPPLWPVKLTDVCGQLQFADLDPAAVNELGEGILVRTMASNHPNSTSVYRATWEGVDIVYGLDCEITDDFEATYVRFVHGCDCLLYDGAYTDEDYPRCVGFGHSTMSKSAAIAEKAGIRRVFVMHYDYTYTDEQLRQAERELTGHAGVSFAREGQCIDLLT